eukprot:TRINITY_DN30363_c0_g1_i1.p1 TRINITY_DN30363_c0_g1~~TRINITY_DN30363_c0_g1_i1.p1  ORF type:complete len:549 (+),score=117.87 TRINITY_DN30363_c0_g1_i1:217-1647(+)
MSALPARQTETSATAAAPPAALTEPDGSATAATAALPPAPTEPDGSATAAAAAPDVAESSLSALAFASANAPTPAPTLVSAVSEARATATATAEAADADASAAAEAGTEEGLAGEGSEEEEDEDVEVVKIAQGSTASAAQPCLCVFDIDRTLTGKQGDLDKCPGNKVLSDVYDQAYGGGKLTLSRLAVAGLNATFCARCYLGVVSAGSASGHGSREREYFVKHVLRTGVFDDFAGRVAAATEWMYGPVYHGGKLRSPLVLRQPDRQKQTAVKAMHSWYASQGVEIDAKDVYFFGDRTENIPAFHGSGFNAQEVSCDSRDWSHGGKIGYCGGSQEEVNATRGVLTCRDKKHPSAPDPEQPLQCKDTEGWRNGFRGCHAEGYGHQHGCTSDGWTCWGYVYRGWCRDGYRRTGGFAFGRWMNYPERNCCQCGGGAVGNCKQWAVRRRRRAGDMCSCRRRSDTAGVGRRCEGDRIVETIR